MAEVMFVVTQGEQFLVMALDGSVRRYRAQNWGIESLDATGQFVVGDSGDPSEWDGPHSRACGITRHAHGKDCAPDCPTCAGGT